MAHTPKFFDEELNRDITRLLALKKAPGREARKKYWALFEDIKKHHKICSSTIYGEMRKDRPGTYKGHVYHSLNIPVTPEEQRMFEELLARKMIISEIQKYMSRTLGIPYGSKRVMRLRKMIAANPSPPAEPSAFDDNIRALFYSFSKLDLSDPEASHIIRLQPDPDPNIDKGKGSKAKPAQYKVSTDALKDALDIIIYSAESGGLKTSAIHRIKMEQMLSRRMHFVEKGLSITTPEMRQLEAIRKSLEQSPQSPQSQGLSPDIRVLVDCVREFNPEASIPDIIASAAKHSEKNKNCKMEVGAYMRELLNIGQEVLSECV
jgi:hypothetical protein